MKRSDLAAMINAIMPAIQDYLIKTVSPLVKRVSDLEARSGIDDIQVDYDGERRLSLKFVQGAKVKSVELVLPIPIDRGVWDENTGYEKGDTITAGGSLWICQKNNHGQRPGTTPAWRLGAKKGKDGRDDGRAG